MLRLALVFILTLFGLGASCDKTSFLSGDLGRVSDAVLVECTPYGKTRHSCLVVSNPWKQQLRVFDITQNEYVLAPNGFFPLAVKVGDFTGKLASHPKSPFVYALDTPGNKIFVSSLNGSNGNLSFSSPNEINTGESPANFTLFEDSNGDFWAAVTLPKSGKLQLIPIDPASGEKALDRSVREVNIEGKPFDVAVVPGGAQVIVSNSSTANVNIVNLVDLTIFSPIDIGGPGAKIAAGQFDLGKGIEPFAVVLRQDQPKAAFITLSDMRFLGNIDFESLALQVYIPSGETSTCCGDVKEWIAIVTSGGKLVYVELSGLKNGDGINRAKKTTVDLTDAKSLGAQAALPSAMVGGNVLIPQVESEGGEEEKFNTQRRTFFTFETGVIAFAEEGKKTIKRLGSR